MHDACQDFTLTGQSYSATTLMIELLAQGERERGGGVVKELFCSYPVPLSVLCVSIFYGACVVVSLLVCWWHLTATTLFADYAMALSQLSNGAAWDVFIRAHRVIQQVRPEAAANSANAIEQAETIVAKLKARASLAAAGQDASQDTADDSKSEL